MTSLGLSSVTCDIMTVNTTSGISISVYLIHVRREVTDACSTFVAVRQLSSSFLPIPQIWCNSMYDMTVIFG